MSKREEFIDDLEELYITSGNDRILCFFGDKHGGGVFIDGSDADLIETIVQVINRKPQLRETLVMAILTSLIFNKDELFKEKLNDVTERVESAEIQAKNGVMNEEVEKVLEVCKKYLS